MPVEPVHRTVLVLDIEGFGRPERGDLGRLALRAALDRLLTESLAHAGVDPDRCERSDQGDGWLILVAPDVPTVRLVDPFVRLLDAALRAHDHDVPDAARLRLRLAVHAGGLLRDRHGWCGTDLNLAFRLCDATPVREALRDAPTARLVAVVSDLLFHGIVRHGYGTIDPAAWTAVDVAEKETRVRAWIHLPGNAVPGGPGDHPAATVRRRTAAPPVRRGDALVPAPPGQANRHEPVHPAALAAHQSGARLLRGRLVAAPDLPATPNETPPRLAAAVPHVITQIMGDATVGNVQNIGVVRGDVTLHLSGGPAAPDRRHRTNTLAEASPTPSPEEMGRNA